MSILTFESVSKSYDKGKNKALNGVSFEVEENEIVGLIGKNGAGKSTAIKIASRMIEEYAGTVRIDGKDVSTIPIKDYPLSYVPDEPVYYEFMTFGEHLDFVHSLYPGQNIFSIEDLVDMFDIEKHLSKFPNELSKGTRQKLSIALAFLRDFRILIADEPFSGLDPQQISVFRKCLLRLKAAGKTVLISTHLLDMVDSLCDTYIILDQGSVLASGSREDLSLRSVSHKELSLEQIFLKFTNSSKSPSPPSPPSPPSSSSPSGSSSPSRKTLS